MTDSSPVTADSTVSEHGAQIAASMLRITVAEYREHEARDEHWCGRCRYWMPRRAFYVDRRAVRGCDSLCKSHRLAVMQATRRMQRDRQRGISYAGPAFSRVALTPEGRAVSSVVPTIVSAQRLVPSADPAPSGPHAHCPPGIRHLCEGRLPEGWVRASEVAS